MASMIAESILSPDFTKTMQSRRQYQGMWGHFSPAKKNQPKTNVKWQVMAADVKMCEMIAELNLPLATADFLTNILIGRELTVTVSIVIVALLCTHVAVSHTVSVAWILSWSLKLKVVPTNKIKSPPHLLNFCWVHMLYHADSCPNFHCVSETLFGLRLHFFAGRSTPILAGGKQVCVKEFCG